MKGLIIKATMAACVVTAMAASGCGIFDKCYDPCWPERWNYLARQEVYAASAPQIVNGHVLDQTIWNWNFEKGTDKLHPSGLEKLDYIIRRRPQPDTHVFVQTAGDIEYDPAAPEKFIEKRSDLDVRRVQAVEKYLMAASAGRGAAWQVAVHDPGDPSLRAIPVGNAVMGMYGSFSGTLGNAGGGLGFGGISTGGLNIGGGALGGGGAAIGGAGAGAAAGGGAGPR
jgi:uncharacterized membrane protein YgcG